MTGEQLKFDFQQGWRPVSQLRPGHYATGRTAGGAEVHIFCDAGSAIWNVATGERAAVNGWKRR